MAYEFVYPGSDLDRSRVLLSILGSFWARTYTAVDQVRSYVDATAQSVAQSHRNLLEAVAALSRVTVPLYHTENWTPITLRRSDANTGLVGVGRFDTDQLAFGDGRASFDTPIQRPYFAFPKPDKLVGVAQIFNKLIFPTVALTDKVDYILDETRGALVFSANPFDSPGFLKRGIYKGKDLVDEEITVWGFHGQFDYDYVFNQFAYALGMRLKTSQGAKDLMNAVYSGLVNGGATVRDLDAAVAAICGVPLTVEPEETVEVVQVDARGLFIATDKNVYRFQENAAPVVAVGDKLLVGSRLTDALEIVTLTSGQVPASISALTLDQGFLAACFYGDLVFENKDLPLAVDAAHPSGYTFVKFPLGGFPADVARFFDDLHARGVAAAQIVPDPCDRQRRKLGTLAHMLDRRAQPESEPTANNLPSTINPLKFIVANILRNNVIIVRIKGGALGQNRLGLYNIRHLRQLLPPQAAMIVIYDMAPVRDALNGAENLAESVATFTGAEPLSDTVTDDLVRDNTVYARTISGTCQ